jgi:phosphoglycerate dehydrogenase-like enzyme
MSALISRSIFKSSRCSPIAVSVAFASSIPKTKFRTMSSKIRVAILDDYQGIAESKFSHLSSKVEVSSFPETLNSNIPDQKAKLIARLEPFTVISTMRERTPLPPDVLGSLPNLKLLLTTGVHNASIPLPTCSERGIIVAGATGAVGRTNSSSTPKKYPNSLDSTLQHIWSLILGIAKNTARDDAVVKHGGWQSSTSSGLKDATLGLLGLGRLGAMTAKVAVYGFGMKIAAWSNSLTQEAADERAKECGLPAGTFKVVGSKEELFRTADILSVHYVLSPRSKDIVGAKELEAMKPSALFVNTSRGPLVNEEALLKVLKEGKIRGAALDVFNQEPLPLDSEWRTTPWGKEGRSEVLLSPHMGYVEEGVMGRWYEETADNVERWLDGKELMHKMN